MDWISVDDALPIRHAARHRDHPDDYSAYVLVWLADPYPLRARPQIATHCTIWMGWEDESGRTYMYPITHWMPLPKGPTG